MQHTLLALRRRNVRPRIIDYKGEIETLLAYGSSLASRGYPLHFSPAFFRM